MNMDGIWNGFETRYGFCIQSEDPRVLGVPVFVCIMPKIQNPQYCRILERIVGIFIFARVYAQNDKNTPIIIFVW